jgi:hypothetical protein
MKKVSKKKLKNDYVLEDEVDLESKINMENLEEKYKDMGDFKDVLVYTHSEDERIRLKALKELCPCKVKNKVEVIWERIFEMVDDENDQIRYQVLHNICDGSPPYVEEKMSDALEKFNRDKDPEIRRRAHKVLASYLRTGKWNVL